MQQISFHRSPKGWWVIQFQDQIIVDIYVLPANLHSYRIDRLIIEFYKDDNQLTKTLNNITETNSTYDDSAKTVVVN